MPVGIKVPQPLKSEVRVPEGSQKEGVGFPYSLSMTKNTACLNLIGIFGGG